MLRQFSSPATDDMTSTVQYHIRIGTLIANIDCTLKARVCVAKTEEELALRLVFLLVFICFCFHDQRTFVDSLD